jgi:cytoskeletal protein CcmA (bactofilin family)
MSQHLRQHRRVVAAFTRVLAGLVLLSFVLAPTVMAFDARNGEQLTIGASEIITDDLYLAGQSITIDGTVQGDVVAAGQIITVNGTIEGGLIVAAQTIIVNGTVRDSARLAAQAIALEPQARVGRDLVAFAYSVENRAGSTVGRDVTVGAYQALLAGSIGRNVSGGMAGLEIRGGIGGDVNVSVGADEETAQPYMAAPPAIAIPVVRPGLTIADTAQIGGRLTYESARAYPVGGQIRQGATWNARAAEPQSAPSLVSVVADNVRRLVALCVIGLLLLWLLPQWTERLAATIEGRPLPSIGWGFVAASSATGAVIGLAVVTIVLAVAFGAFTLSSLAGLVVVLGLLGDLTLAVGLTVFAAFVAQAIVSYLAGRLLLQRLYPAALTHRAAPLLAGAPVFVILSAIPAIGGLIALLAALATFGAVWIRVRDRREPARAMQPAPAAAAAAA